MPKRIRLVPDYAPLTVGDAELMVRKRAPSGALADLQSGDIDRVLAGMAQIVHEHPWVDEQDQPLAIRDLDTDLLAEIVKAYSELLAAPKA